MASPAIPTSVRLRQIETPLLLTLAGMAVCFAPVLWSLIHDWLNEADAAHGILIAPVAIWLMYSKGANAPSEPRPWLGALAMITAGTVSFVGRTSGAATPPRAALLLAIFGAILWWRGWKQVVAWWLPLVLFALTIPVPATILGSLTQPLQTVAAKMGANLLSWRHIPVLLSGNVIRLPGHALFVSEACSGLRSLTAIVSMAVLVGALFLRYPISRVLVLFLSIGLAIVVNGFRVFMTGFLVFFVDQKLGEGFMHLTEGYLLFLISLAILSGLTWVFIRVERRIGRFHDGPVVEETELEEIAHSQAHELTEEPS